MASSCIPTFLTAALREVVTAILTASAWHPLRCSWQPALQLGQWSQASWQGRI